LTASDTLSAVSSDAAGGAEASCATRGASSSDPPSEATLAFFVDCFVSFFDDDEVGLELFFDLSLLDLRREEEDDEEAEDADEESESESEAESSEESEEESEDEDAEVERERFRDLDLEDLDLEDLDLEEDFERDLRGKGRER
jgi:hypothetical protein